MPPTHSAKVGCGEMGRGVADGVKCPFPVGMWCLYDGSESPSVFWPGTSWAKMEGRFLFGSGSGRSVGVTGGEESHKLTEAELPVIKPNANCDWEYTNKQTEPYWALQMNGNTGDGIGSWPFSSFGGDQPHNNMPPYYVTNMWRRTA